MNDPFLVRRLQRVGDLARRLQCVLHRQWTPGEAIGECLAIHQFHDQGLD